MQVGCSVVLFIGKPGTDRLARDGVARGGYVLREAGAGHDPAVVGGVVRGEGAERNELASPVAKPVIGVLLFQDLAVVPLLILLPALGVGAGMSAMEIGWIATKVVVLLGLLLGLPARGGAAAPRVVGEPDVPRGRVDVRRRPLADELRPARLGRPLRVAGRLAHDRPRDVQPVHDAADALEALVTLVDGDFQDGR